MLKIRLQRVGKKHDPSFRVVLTDSRKGPQSGGFLEVLGSYNARKGEPILKGEKIKEWMAKGAQVSDTVNNLLVKAGIIKGEKRNVLHHDKIRREREKKEAEAKPKERTEEKAEKKPEEATPAEEEAASGEEKPGEGKEDKKEEEKPAEPKQEESTPEEAEKKENEADKEKE